MKKKGSPLEHFAIISGGAFFNLLIGILTTPIITRLVDPYEYGQLSMFNLYASMSVMVFCIGLDQALVRFYYHSDTLEYRRYLLRKCWLLPIISWCGFAAVFLITYFKGFFKFEFNWTITLILMVYVLVQILNRISILVLRLEYHSAKYTLINIINKVCYTLLVIMLIKLINKQYLLILTIATVISSLLTLLLSVFMEREVWFGNNQIDKTNVISIKQLIKYGSPFILSMGITTVFQGIDKLSLNYFSTYSEIGIYSSAMSLVNIFAILQSSFNALWAPMATEHYEKNRSDLSFYTKGNTYITILMFTTGICLIFAKDVFAIILGDRYSAAAYILPCLCFNPIMYTISETTVSGINFAKKSYLHIWVAVISCITNIIGNIILVPIYGGRGAAISTGISYIVFFIARTFFANKYYPINFKLNRLYALTSITFIYALYNTFIPFNVVTILGFVVCILVLWSLYRHEIKEGLEIGYSKCIELKLNKKK